jgi:hypothetical protein
MRAMKIALGTVLISMFTVGIFGQQRKIRSSAPCRP